VNNDEARRLIIEKMVSDTIQGCVSGSALTYELTKCLDAMDKFGIVMTDDERIAAIDKNMFPSEIIIAAGEAMNFDRLHLWQKLADERLPMYSRCNTDTPEEAAGLVALIEVALAKKVKYDHELTKGYVVNAIAVYVKESEHDQQIAVMDDRLAAYAYNRDKLRAALRKHPSPLLSGILDRANGKK